MHVYMIFHTVISDTNNGVMVIIVDMHMHALQIISFMKIPQKDSIAS